jgi:hypothetical protein
MELAVQLVVHHEAGPAFAPLAGQLRTIAETVAPLVEAATGLQLPDLVVIRTMTAKRWLTAHRRSGKRRLRSEVKELRGRVTVEERAAARAQRVRNQTGRRSMWPQIGAQAVEFTPGRPELVILPEALQHGGRLDDLPVLHKVVAHELTHLAQYTAGAGATWAAQDTFFPGSRGVAGRDYTLLVEGHAYRADRIVTGQLFGRPVETTEISPAASPVYRRLVSPERRAETAVAVDRTVTAVSTVIDGVGLAAFNGVWITPDLVPMRHETETDRIDAWRARFSAGMPPSEAGASPGPTPDNGRTPAFRASDGPAGALLGVPRQTDPRA